VLEKGDRIDVGSLPTDLGGVRGPGGANLLPEVPQTYELAMAAFEKAFLQDALSRHGSDLAKTALAVGLTRKALTQKLTQLGLPFVPAPT